MDRSILKTGIPAGVVVSVLAFSMLFPAAGSQSNSPNHGGDDHGYGGQCGYGQVQDNDENDNNNTRGADTVKTMQKQKHDNDCKEDENDGEGDGGGDRAVTSTNLGSIVYASTVTRHFRNPTPR
jgi:hypothetical protein